MMWFKILNKMFLLFFFYKNTIDMEMKNISPKKGEISPNLFDKDQVHLAFENQNRMNQFSKCAVRGSPNDIETIKTLIQTHPKQFNLFFFHFYSFIYSL